MSSYTYTNAYTRAQAVVDQVSVLFSEGGIASAETGKVCKAVQEKRISAVGLFLERAGQRVYEVEANISWSAHSDLAHLQFSSDLPGWEGNGSPEAIILGRRFYAKADAEKLVRRFWVLFTAEVRADPALHERLRSEVGVGGSVSDWAKAPTEHSLPMQDLGEIGLSERSAL